MHRRHFIHLGLGSAAAGLLASCKSPQAAEKPSPAPGPPPSGPGPLPFFDPGRVPSRLPAGRRISFSSCQVSGGYAAMTFDDGPDPDDTPRLLNMLRDWRIRATFYLIGRNVAAYPHIVRRIVQEGHEVGNHSWSHPALSGLSQDRVRDELRRTHQAIVSACGVAPLTYRPPYGAITAAQKDWISREFGYPTIMWSVDPNDWKDRNSATVSSRILNGARNGSIILAHDIHATTVNAMPSTLPALRRRGIKFLTVSQIITMETSGRALVAAADPAPSGLYSPGMF